MADTAHKDPEQVIEYFDPPEVLQEKARKIVEIIRQSKGKVVAFTGAGISTSAGIPDFRGPEGVWTLRAQGKPAKRASVLTSLPTKTHMALLQLVKVGIIDIIISQNTDGLHRKSGVEATRLAELHGNTNLEKCEKCGANYLRDWHVRNPSSENHYTGRKCGLCEGKLRDSIINFGESLPEDQLNRAWDASMRAKLCLVLGSSLTVAPANLLPSAAQSMVICNLQKTHLDKSAKVRVHARCDDLMELIMEYLGLEIPPFRLHRYVEVAVKDVFQPKSGEQIAIHVRAVDSVGTPATIFSRVEVHEWNEKEKEKSAAKLWAAPREKEKFQFARERTKEEEEREEVRVKVEFMGHYGEPPLFFVLPLKEMRSETKGIRKYNLTFDPVEKRWDVQIATPSSPQDEIR